MANNANLEGKGFDDRTTEEQREIARQGGIASGEARRRKRDLKAALEALLEKDYPVKDKQGNIIGTASGTESVAAQLFQRALKGNTKAFEILRDTIGQKPVEKVMIAEVDQSIIEEVERAVMGDG